MRCIIPILLTLSFLCFPWGVSMEASVSPYPQSTSKKRTTAATGKSGAKTTNKKSTGGKNSTKSSSKSTTKTTTKTATSKKSASKKSGTTGTKSASRRRPGQATATVKKDETSADVRRRQEATQKEIKLTEEQIKENEKSIRVGLNELGKLETDIGESGKRISATISRIKELSAKIIRLEDDINSNEKELESLRSEYLKAVKKMRVSRKGNSMLAFVFSSDNFNQAVRRMRYMRQFSEWREKKSHAIEGKTKQLREQKESLAGARMEQDENLKRQQSEEALLKKQYARQDALVAGLKQNGVFLQQHLSKKQTEANQLRDRVSELIAQEERKAAEERARKEAEKRRAEEERLAREQAERERAAKEAEAAQLAEAETKKANEEASKSSATGKDETFKSTGGTSATSTGVATARRRARATAGKTDSKSVTTAEAKTSGKGTEANKGYADARKRRPRGVGDKSSGQAAASTATVASTASSTTSAVGQDFASMKGRLPSPASGGFKVTSRFGRQSLPDLPDVVYDNPGIDAEVSAGASAIAVYPGKVSGVYMIHGYNTVVIVNHGNYYTVYGNIASPSVKVGDKVNAGQGLGSLAPDDDDRSRSSIHFEVWRNREKLNPLEWLR